MALFEPQNSGAFLYELLIYTILIVAPLNMLLNIKKCEQWVESIWGARSKEDIRRENWEVRYIKNLMIGMGAFSVFLILGSLVFYLQAVLKL